MKRKYDVTDLNSYKRWTKKTFTTTVFYSVFSECVFDNIRVMNYQEAAKRYRELRNEENDASMYIVARVGGEYIHEELIREWGHKQRDRLERLFGVKNDFDTPEEII